MTILAQTLENGTLLCRVVVPGTVCSVRLVWPGGWLLNHCPPKSINSDGRSPSRQQALQRFRAGGDAYGFELDGFLEVESRWASLDYLAAAPPEAVRFALDALLNAEVAQLEPAEEARASGPPRRVTPDDYLAALILRYWFAGDEAVSGLDPRAAGRDSAPTCVVVAGPSEALALAAGLVKNVLAASPSAPLPLRRTTPSRIPPSQTLEAVQLDPRAPVFCGFATGGWNDPHAVEWRVLQGVLGHRASEALCRREQISYYHAAYHRAWNHAGFVGMVAWRRPGERSQIAAHLRSLVQSLVAEPPSAAEMERVVCGLRRRAAEARASAPAAATWCADRWHGLGCGAALDDEAGLRAVSAATVRKALDENGRMARAIPGIDSSASAAPGAPSLVSRLLQRFALGRTGRIQGTRDCAPPRKGG